jgi:hypothetical protein
MGLFQAVTKEKRGANFNSDKSAFKSQKSSCEKHHSCHTSLTVKSNRVATVQ